MRRIIDICWRLCKQVPLLPITILSVIPLALLGEWKPWGEAAWDSWISQVGVDGLSAFNPGVGQWIVIALVAYTIVVTVRGMIDDLRHGHVGVDLLAVVAIASTVAVQEYWAAWAVVLMISSGEAIEEFAQSNRRDDGCFDGNRKCGRDSDYDSRTFAYDPRHHCGRTWRGTGRGTTLSGSFPFRSRAVLHYINHQL